MCYCLWLGSGIRPPRTIPLGPFFSGDNQKNMDFCLDLLESAAQHHLLVNFHGATIPRGWQRTYPNLMSTEAVYGAEWYNNVPTFTDQAARHNATLPFTRNIIGSMDYTPCTFSDSQHPHITTNAHELALTVLFESGLQHLADKPESYLAQPQEIQDFLSNLPSTWDETKFIEGEVGKRVIIARRKGKTWYVAGINGTDLFNIGSLDLRKYIKGQIKEAIVYEDNYTRENMTNEPGIPVQPKLVSRKDYYGQDLWKITKSFHLPESADVLPRGGFVMVIQEQ